ncbi:MAG TPA: hypothetical protein VK797_20095 [Tepidisphaeraceae bacterium]|nr:hypothetical protein [Tepidisphaeraceae bacterium]
MIESIPTRTRNAAEIEAEANYRGNLEELAGTQPALGARISDVGADVQWIFARDGSLTAMQAGERWWGDCSLPRRAGQFMFRTMEIHGVVACFLNPIHAAHLGVTLAMLEPQQAIIAIVSDPLSLWIMLHCGDFATETRSHRLWLVTGQDWESDLSRLFVENPGLPTPSQFIRAISTDNGPADALIEPAQRVFADEQNRRAALIRSAFENRMPRANQRRKLCLLAPSRFRLWNDAPCVLAGIAKEAGETCRFDPDDPASASPLALAQVACECDAVVAANLSRVDLPGVVPDDMPWVTWVTLGRIPRRDDCGKHDRLLIADTQWLSEARGLGWKEKGLQLAGWPALELPQAPGEGFIAMIADTRPLEAPKHVTEYSSHILLWELIQNELSADPFLISSVVPQAADQYLESRIAQLRVAEESLNKAFFLEHLVVPAYQQGLARLLIEHRLPVRLFGSGWDKIPPFAEYGYGAIETREHFTEILAQSAAVVHAWPSDRVHPIDAIGRPVLRAFGRTREEFLRQPIRPALAPDAVRLSPKQFVAGI